MPCTCYACTQPRRPARGAMRGLHPGVLPPPYGNGLGHGIFARSTPVPLVLDLVSEETTADDGTVTERYIAATPAQVTRVFQHFMEQDD